MEPGQSPLTMQIVWRGNIVVKEPDQHVLQVSCQASAKQTSLPMIHAEKWSNILYLTYYPKSMLNQLKDRLNLSAHTACTVNFQFNKPVQNIAALKAITSMEPRNFGVLALQHQTNVLCPIKAMLLVWIDRQFCGIIPSDQNTFIRTLEASGIKQVMRQPNMSTLNQPVGNYGMGSGTGAGMGSGVGAGMGSGVGSGMGSGMGPGMQTGMGTDAPSTMPNATVPGYQGPGHMSVGVGGVQRPGGQGLPPQGGAGGGTVDKRRQELLSMIPPPLLNRVKAAHTEEEKRKTQELITNYLKSQIQQQKHQQQLLQEGDAGEQSEKGIHPNMAKGRDSLPEMNDSFLSCYQEALEKHGVVSVEINRAIFIGSSGAGKSSLKYLLIHNESKEMKTSTPLMETPDVVVVGEHYAVDKGSSTWKVVTPTCLNQSVKSCTVDKHYQECRQYPTSITQPEKVSQVENAISEMESDRQVLNVSLIQKTDHAFLKELEQERSAFLQEVDSPEEGIKLEKQKFLHLIDSGGQPFFQDVLPLLIAIPSTYVLVFDASKDLDSAVQATYRPQEGEELHIASHSETHWEFIQRTLSGMQTMAHKFLYTNCKIFKGAKPELRILFTGTFKDAVKKSQGSDEIIANIQRKFDSLKGKPYYKCITWDQNGRIFLVDNHLTLHPNVSEEDYSYLNHLRGCITGNSTALKVDVPLMWFLLQVFTECLAKKFIKEEDLKLFCLKHQYIDEDKANEQFHCLLKLLHFLGFYAYFDLEPTYLKDGTNYVCTDGTAFYHEVSKLLAVQYNPAQSGVVKEFQDRGLVCSPYEELFKELDICPDVDPAWLLEVLHHIGIAARLGSSSIGGPPSYFIPSSLPYGRADVPGYSSVEPLCFTFVFERDSFSTYCDLPRSVFCRLVVELADREWRVIPQASDRTCVKFACPKRSTYVYLIEKPDHICCQVIIDESFPLDAHDNSFSLKEIHRHCSTIRNRLEDNLHCITQEIFGVKFQKFAKIVPVLPCSCQHTPHYTAPVDSGALVGSCVHCGKCAVMLPQQRVWFSPLSPSEAKVCLGKENGISFWKIEKVHTSTGDDVPLISKRSPTDGCEGHRPEKSRRTVTTEYVIKSTRDFLPYLGEMVDKLSLLGSALDMDTYAASIVDSPGNPQDKCIRILQHWISSTPEDQATWREFCSKLAVIAEFNKLRDAIGRDHPSPDC